MHPRLAFAALPLLPLLACLVPPAGAADVAAIKDKLELCVSCHGKDGISDQQEIPSLAGQPDLFLQWQLIYFRGGARKSPQMSPVAADLTNEDVRNLGAHFAALKPPAAPADDPDPQLSAAGAKLVAQRRCISCHSDNFAGTKATARLAGQREDYLVKALTDFKTGKRSGGGVAAMADVAYGLQDDEVKALAHYLAHFKG
ncbi:c-type cytochrome [Bradyrhizobium sp. WD16]|uniref:c-type cytochrome n=1 Tax=Bradyrhizobium sp. WD16 TaxID=1521768 RepID=UPI0020A61794|nr:c-type cytochrome [Bradyrhizobium sp. WD16]UTD25949.1 cytochrome c4 [Bradyrhizobium sp. WD16]